jgi:hypothetical protein
MQARERLFNNLCNYFIDKPKNRSIDTVSSRMQATNDSNYEPEQQHLTIGATSKHSGQAFQPVKTKADIFISALLYGALERI